LSSTFIVSITNYIHLLYASQGPIIQRFAERLEIPEASRLKEIEMKWRYDYHGSRTYGSDEPMNRLGLMLAWLAAVARRKFQRPAGEIRLFDGKRHFSVLGADSNGRRGDNSALPPVPPQVANVRDWRVLP
jgi:hypothetical protein